MAFDAAAFLAELFAPAPRLNPEDLSEELRSAYEERAAVKEFCGNMARGDSEREAWAELMKDWEIPGKIHSR